MASSRCTTSWASMDTKQPLTCRSVDRLLSDVGWAIANARGDPTPEHPRAPAGASARERLEVATQGLIGSQLTTATIVWLEYLQATLRWPPTLHIGDRVTLFNADFLRALIHERPEDERVPAELRDPNTSGLRIWLGAYEREEALSSEPQRGDPRVLIRIELDPNQSRHCCSPPVRPPSSSPRSRR